MDQDIPLTNWPKEDIPNFDRNSNDYLLYRHIHKTYIKKTNPEIISPSSFKDPQGTGISTDWGKYSSPQKTQKRSEKNPPEDYGVVSLKVREIREKEELNKLTIEHAPKQKTINYEGNQAHTNINGLLKYGLLIRETQVLLSRLAKWEINKRMGLE